MKNEKIHTDRNAVGVMPSPHSTGVRGEGVAPTLQLKALKDEATGLVNSGISRRFYVFENTLFPYTIKEWAGVLAYLKGYKFIANYALINGNGISAKQFKTNLSKKNHNVIRTEIQGFSKNSKIRMSKHLFKLNWDILKSENKRSKIARGVFVTLTYPEMDFSDWHLWKKHLEAFRKRLIRKWGDNVSVIWKLENQEGRCERFNVDFIPHFHLIVDLKNKQDVQAIRQWVSKAWYEVVGSNNENHLKVGTNVRAIYGETKKLLFYLSKYMAKTFEVKVKTGRVWGVWNRFEYSPVRVIINIPWNTSIRRLRSYGKKSFYLRNLGKKFQCNGFTLYSPNLERILCPNE